MVLLQKKFLKHFNTATHHTYNLISNSLDREIHKVNGTTTKKIFKTFQHCNTIRPACMCI